MAKKQMDEHKAINSNCSTGKRKRRSRNQGKTKMSVIEPLNGSGPMKAIHLINKLNQLPEVSNKLLYQKAKQNNNYIIHVETCISNDTHINSTS